MYGPVHGTTGLPKDWDVEDMMLRFQLETFLALGNLRLKDTANILGDSIMLPLVNLEELHYMDNWTAQFIGYNPTNTGFQFLQEAYARGEWNGPRPLFKWTKNPYDRMGMKAARQTHKAEATCFTHKSDVGSSANKLNDISAITTPRQEASKNNSKTKNRKRGNNSYDNIETQSKKRKLANSNGNEDGANNDREIVRDELPHAAP